MGNKYLSNVMMSLFSKVGSNFYDLDIVLNDSDKLDFLYDEIYNNISGDIIHLSSVYDDTHIAVFKDRELVNSIKMYKDKSLASLPEACKDAYDELIVIARYMTVLISPNINKDKSELRDNLINVLKTTVQKWDKEFITVLNLILIFNSDTLTHKYRDLVYPLSQLVINLLHLEFSKGVFI